MVRIDTTKREREMKERDETREEDKKKKEEKERKKGDKSVLWGPPRDSL